nr:uncharacterized protein LOC114082864 isoform X2 [Marmota flaviventris]
MLSGLARAAALRLGAPCARWLGSRAGVPAHVVDLRSDTVTRPGPAMRRAMAEAVVGDDDYGEDPTVRELQERAAQLLGVEQTLFVPTNTMANLICVMGHCRRRGSQLLLGQECHLHVYEQGGVAQVRTRHHSPGARTSSSQYRWPRCCFLGTWLEPAEKGESLTEAGGKVGGRTKSQLCRWGQKRLPAWCLVPCCPLVSTWNTGTPGRSQRKQGNISNENGPGAYTLLTWDAVSGCTEQGKVLGTPRWEGAGTRLGSGSLFQRTPPIHQEVQLDPWTCLILHPFPHLQIAGVHSHLLPDLPHGTLDLDELERVITRGLGNPYHPVCELVCLENTHSSSGGRVLPIDYLRQVHLLAQSHGARVHLDGARLMNAAVALRVPPARIVEHCDSVSFCLSKGLGAPVGALVGGPKDFIQEAWRLRKALGGGMRQAGVLAAAALVGLAEAEEELPRDHENARRTPGLGIAPLLCGSCCCGDQHGAGEGGRAARCGPVPAPAGCEPRRGGPDRPCCARAAVSLDRAVCACRVAP